MSTVGFVPAAAGGVVAQVINTAAAMFVADQVLRDRGNPSEPFTGAEVVPNDRQPFHDAPEGTSTCVRFLCNGHVHNRCFSGGFAIGPGASEGSVALHPSGGGSPSVDSSYCPLGFSIVRISNSAQGFEDNTSRSADDLRNEAQRRNGNAPLSTGVSAQRDPSGRPSPNRPGGRNPQNVADSIRDAVQGIRDIVNTVTRRPSSGGGGGGGGGGAVTLPDIINEITINVNADIERVITAMLEQFAITNGLLDTKTQMLISLLTTIGSQLTQFEGSTNQALDLITNLLTEALPELENIEQIRARLEQVFSGVEDLDSDLQLTAGIVQDVLDVATQVLQEAEEIGRKQDDCEAQEEEEEEEGCCELIEEMHEIITGQYGASFLFSPDCEKKNLELAEWGGDAFASTNAGLAVIGERLNIIGRRICEIETVAAVPEGWNLRPENQRAQLVVQLATDSGSKKGRGYRQITIPHYSGNERVPPISYTSGRFYGILVLADNSKVRVYCSSMGAAESVLRQIRGLISGSMTANSYIVTGEIKKPIQSHQLRSVKASYFAAGHAPGTSPLWVARVPKN